MKKIKFYFGIALIAAAFAITGLPGSAALAQESRPGDAALANLLKKIDAQATPDSYRRKNHQAWVDARMAKLTEAQKKLNGRLWAAKRMQVT